MIGGGEILHLQNVIYIHDSVNFKAGMINGNLLRPLTSSRFPSAA